MKFHSVLHRSASAFHMLVAVALVVSVLGATQGRVQTADAAIAGMGVEGVRTAGLTSDDVARTKSESLEETPSVDMSSLRRAATKAATPVVAVRRSRATSTGWRSAVVSWYGPGFYGNTMAGGGKLTTTSMVVAHRTMRFGTRVEFLYKGKRCIAVVQDRGPFVAGRTFDLGPGTAKALGFSGVGTVQWRIVR